MAVVKKSFQIQVERVDLLKNPFGTIPQEIVETYKQGTKVMGYYLITTGDGESAHALEFADNLGYGMGVLQKDGSVFWVDTAHCSPHDIANMFVNDPVAFKQRERLAPQTREFEKNGGKQ